MFFSGWDGIWRVLIVGALAYAGLVMLLRVSGKRTLSKMNAFDLVVTVALGSTLATILLSKETALAEGLTAYALLIALQFLVAWGSTRAAWFDAIVKSEPALLFHRGEFLDMALRRERVTHGEVTAAIRSSGILSFDDVAAVVLETDGTMSVVSQGEGGASERSTISQVKHSDDVPASSFR